MLGNFDAFLLSSVVYFFEINISKYSYRITITDQWHAFWIKIKPNMLLGSIRAEIVFQRFLNGRVTPVTNKPTRFFYAKQHCYM